MFEAYFILRRERPHCQEGVKRDRPPALASADRPEHSLARGDKGTIPTSSKA
jgi:hypothetical protein